MISSFKTGLEQEGAKLEAAQKEEIEKQIAELESLLNAKDYKALEEKIKMFEAAAAQFANMGGSDEATATDKDDEDKKN